MAFDPKDPEAVAAINAAVEEAVRPLVAKRDELLGEVKKLRKSAEITPEALSAVEAERDDLAAKLADATKAAKAAEKVAEAAVKQLASESTFTQSLLIDNGLTAELTRHGVTDLTYIKAAKALLRSDVQVVVDGDNRVAKVGDKALADHVKEWTATDEGKRFVSAPGNSGGNAPGGSARPTGPDMSKLPPAQRLAAAREAQAAR